MSDEGMSGPAEARPPAAEASSGSWIELRENGIAIEHRLMIVGHADPKNTDDIHWRAPAWPDEVDEKLLEHVRHCRIGTPFKHTPEEILRRIGSIGMEDWLGTQRQELISALDFENAKQFLKEEATPELWEQSQLFTVEGVRAEAEGYLPFAVEKAGNHRGLSAGRSVDHFAAWVWLAEPERYEEFEDAGYTNYGAPKLKAAAQILGLSELWDRLVPEDSAVARMAEGRTCGGWDGEGCNEGCSYD